MFCRQGLKQDLRISGYQVTPQRAVILETIANLEGHHNAQQVYQLAQARLPGLNILTVYRTLDSFHQGKFSDLFPNRTGTLLFALHEDSNIHHHLHGVHCGKV